MASPQLEQNRSGSFLASDLGKGLAAFLFITVFAFLAIYEQGPPAAVSSSAPASEFASGRAMAHLQAIAQKPRPVGSPEHAITRDYLISQLSGLGLAPEVQKTFAVNQRQRIFNAAAVENVVARLKGTDSTKAIMLTSHYDSVPNSPGANDDGSGVSVVLETMRALQSGDKLKNDVIALFTDSEEPGLLGAKAFADEHPWAKDVGLVLNFEARGSGGPVLMFETSDGNSELIEEFAESCPDPVSNSMLNEVYKILPNDTDLTAFKSAGMEGLNFAPIAGVSRYHTATDSLENVDERTIQHHGLYALALARHFGNLDRNRASGDSVYFSLLGLIVVRYSTFWVMPLTVVVGLIFIAVAVVSYRKGLLSIKSLTWGVLAFLASLVLAVIVVTAVWWLIRSVHGQYRSIRSDTYNSTLYLASFAALTISIFSLLQIWLRKKVPVAALWMGAMALWVVLMVVTGMLLPGASYLFTWPLLFSLIAYGLVYFSRDKAQVTGRTLAAIGLSTIPAVILWSPLIVLFFYGLTVNASPVVMALLVLLLGLHIYHLSLIAASNRWVVPGALALVGIGFILAGAATAGVDRNQPKQDHLFFGSDADTGQSIVASGDAAPDEWTGQFFSADRESSLLEQYFPFSPRKFMTSAVESPPFPSPEVVALGEKREGEGRDVTLRITSPRRAPIVSVHVTSETEVRGFLVNGRRIEVKDVPTPAGREVHWQFNYYGLPPEGIELTLQLNNAQPVALRVVDQSYGLPEAVGRSFKERFEYTIPSPLPFNNATLVSKSFRL